MIFHVSGETPLLTLSGIIIHTKPDWQTKGGEEEEKERMKGPAGGVSF